jgi:hypothetical protein
MDRVSELAFLFFFLYMTRRNGQLNTCTLSNALTNSHTGTNNQVLNLYERYIVLVKLMTSSLLTSDNWLLPFTAKTSHFTELGSDPF